MSFNGMTLLGSRYHVRSPLSLKEIRAYARFIVAVANHTGEWNLGDTTATVNSATFVGVFLLSIDGVEKSELQSLEVS